MPQFDAKDKSKFETFSRRSLLVSGGMTAVFAVLVGRLYQLQIVRGDEYLTAAEDNRINLRLLVPPRGRIYDRFGTVLAANRRNYRALVVPEQTLHGIKATLDTLAKVIPINDRQRARILKEAAASRSFIPIVVAENLPWEDFARLNLDLPYLRGVQPDVGETRDYPFGPELSHVLGYVAPISKAEKAKATDTDPLYEVPGFRIGKRGVEKAYETRVRGSAGSSRVEVNAYGRVIRELERQPGQPGEAMYLTIDRDLQRYAYDLLKEESAACVVMDCHTGDVLAFLSTPGYDPNAFNIGLTPEHWKSLNENDHKPLLNKVLSGVYPPGSTFKPIVALAALEAGVVTPDFTVGCSGGMPFGGRIFHCWKRGGHGAVNMRTAIQRSCDVYFYQVGLKTGVDNIHKTATELGLGVTTGIEIPGEKTGTIPSEAWKRRVIRDKWHPGDTLSAAIGQGYTIATPMQLALAAARIASGLNVQPRIVHTIGNVTTPRPTPKPLPMPAEALQVVRDGLNMVANVPGGTAYRWRIEEPGFEMAGKTGTAQVRVITAAERAGGVRRNEDLPWKLRDHSLFFAHAPVHAPRYAAAIVLEHGAVAAHPNVSMIRDILLYAQKRKIVSLPTAYPATSATAEATSRT
jgi:penicillin-binding protein 2